MMHTKGKLEQCDYTQRELWIGADYHIATVHGNQTFREANAQRLVKCWNKYDSLKAKADVCDELVKVCEMVLRSKALILPKGGFMKAENADEIRALLTMYDNVEQALAKAERIE